MNNSAVIPGEMRVTIPRPCTCAHRGGGKLAPENSMVAYKNAVDLGIHMLEIDLRKTKDGIIVLQHEEDISEVSDGKGSVTKYTYEQLLQFDYGYQFKDLEGNHSYRGKGIKILKLTQALDYFRAAKPDLLFYFDIKQAGLMPEVNKILQNYNIAPDFGCVFHENHKDVMKSIPSNIRITPSLEQIQDLFLEREKTNKLPNIPTIAMALPIRLKGAPPDHLRKECQEGTPLYDKELCTAEVVQECHAQGAVVYLYAFDSEIDRPEVQEEYLKRGVDIIMTDRPDVLVKTVERFKAAQNQ